MVTTRTARPKPLLTAPFLTASPSWFRSRSMEVAASTPRSRGASNWPLSALALTPPSESMLRLCSGDASAAINCPCTLASPWGSSRLALGAVRWGSLATWNRTGHDELDRLAGDHFVGRVGQLDQYLVRTGLQSDEDD